MEKQSNINDSTAGLPLGQQNNAGNKTNSDADKFTKQPN